MHFVQVASKTQQFEITRTDAIFEVYTDRIIEKTQDCDKALLWIVSQEISEFSVSYFNDPHYNHKQCAEWCDFEFSISYRPLS